MQQQDFFDETLLKKIEYAERQIAKIQKDLWWYKQVCFMKERTEKQKIAAEKIMEQLTMFG